MLGEVAQDQDRAQLVFAGVEERATAGQDIAGRQAVGDERQANVADSFAVTRAGQRDCLGWQGCQAVGTTKAVLGCPSIGRQCDRVQAVPLARGPVEEDHSALGIAGHHPVSDVVQQGAGEFLLAKQRFLRPDAIERAAAMIGQGLQGGQAVLVIGPGRVAMNGENANHLGPIADGGKHGGSRGTRCIIRAHTVGGCAANPVFQNQLAPTLNGPARAR